MNRTLRSIVNWSLSKLYFTSDDKKDIFVALRYAVLYFAALFYWELLLNSHFGNESSFYFILFLPAIAVFLTVLTGWFKEKTKLNRLVTPIVMAVPFAFYVSQFIYRRIFQSYFSVFMIGAGEDAIKDFGWALWDTIKGSISGIILCLLPVLVTVLFAFLPTKSLFEGYGKKVRTFSFLSVLLLWGLGVLLLLPFGTGEFSAYNAYHASDIDTDTGASKLGVLPNSVIEFKYLFFGVDESEDDNQLIIPVAPVEPEINTEPNINSKINFEQLKLATNDKDKQELCDYFAALSGTNKNEYTGMLKDYNLIYICAEAFSSHAIDPVVTPTLYKMSQGGIVLNNYYNSFKNTTTNGEFAFTTGLWPDVSRKADANSTQGSFVQSKNKLLPYTLGNMFKNIGVNTYAFHNYQGYYYQRNKTHPNIGYNNLKFMGQGMSFTTAWPSSDYEMMQQSIDDYINQEQFHAYYMTFSGHGPYSTANPIAVRNYKEVNNLLNGRNISNGAKYYLAANYELEKAMKYLIEKLDAAGKLDKTMIVITGDHYPYYLSDNDMTSLIGRSLEQNFEKYLSSCIMYCPGIDTIKVDTPVCNVDILPTILNLWGMEYDSRLLPGTDIFSNNTHIAMIYNKSFVTEYVKYNSQNGEAEWLPAAEKLSEEDRKQHLEYCVAITKSRYTASLKIISEDFYRFVMNSLKEEASVIQ